MAKKDKAEGDAKPGGAKKLIVIGAAAAVLLAGGTGAGVFFLTKGNSASAAEATPTATLTPGTVTALDPISVNLADGHYLKIGVALQGVAAAGGGHGEGSKDTLDGSKAYDLIINEYSNLSMTDLQNSEQRNHYKDELQEKVIEAYKTHDDKGEETEGVMGIYLTSFVMQ
ncbi:flagellar basal body-associated FliL family protein [Kineococcus rhizosphaerae]|uniref:Flagellar protein FliL n=1 Tax=Kineococcus rhizosphaerae TaxID=559628 RepID=A0A2T0RAL9_9ACTN|nr:flagellar basal body-associated FliL family protein [Kineococcus rhizosphaerae]PRY18207.1 flagellar FliL protein [Kineococcus rhizosphaerae]